MKRGPISAIGAILFFAGAACRGPARTVHYDLARDASLAEWGFPGDVRVVGAPRIEVHPRRLRLAEQADEAGSANPHVESNLLVRWPAPAERLAVLDLESPGDAVGGGAVVLLNRREVARIPLSQGRRRYAVPLPAQAQQPGENRLGVAITTGDERASLERAARLWSFAVGGAGQAALRRLVDADLAPFSVTEAGGVPTLVQSGPSVLRYVIRLPRSAELRFTPVATRTVGARVRVTGEAESGTVHELFAGVLRGPSREIALRLPGREGELLRLGLEVDGGTPEAFAQGGWRGPRVLGAGPAGVSPGSPGPDPEIERRAGELRQALRGSSALVLVLDAAGASHFSCYGYPRPTTPAIDRLAAEGVVFERAYTTAPYTIGAVSSLWTSLYPDQHHHGVRHNAPLPSERLTLAEAVSAHGTHAAAFVSNPSAGSPFGLHRGFAEFRELYRAGRQGFRGVPRASEFQPVLDAWMRSVGGQRFLAYVHYLEPHFPYDPPPPFDTRFGPDQPLPQSVRRDQTWIRAVNDGTVQAREDEIAHLARLYDGNLAYVDHEVGRLRQALEAAGLWEKTVVIVTADHGEALMEHGFIGHAWQLYEESLRIPLVVRFPAGRGPRGLRVREQVDLLDVAPTIADILGLPAARWAQAFEGRSLLPVVAGGPGKPALFARTMAERPALAVSDGRFKLIHDLRRDRFELYDLGADPAEQEDLSERRPLLRELYRQALHRWFRDLLRRPGTVEERPLTAEEHEALRALGYIR